MKLLIRSVLTVLLLGTLAAGVAAVLTRRALEERFQAFPGEEVVVEISSGASVREGLALLERKGVIRDQTVARLYWRFALEDPVFMAGEYVFRGPATIREVLDKIRRGDVKTHRVTILEGLTFHEIARHLSDEGFGSYESFVKEMSSPRLIEDFDAEATDLEGYLFPDTYAFSRAASEARIVSAMVAAFRKHFAEARLIAAAAESEISEVSGLGDAPRLSNREVVILASIVEKEATLDEERPLIAGVYAHRLRIGMGLYADPTIIYALKRRGTWDGNLRRKDLEMDSPYNTYRSAGLPPGPICSPGLDSLAAALAPADVPYLYFVSRNDGSHVFARTLAEHNRNVYEWQKLYWQRRWAADAEGDEVH